MTKPEQPVAGLVLPQRVADLSRTVACAERHPGLQLDKFSVPRNQEAQKSAVEKVCRAGGDSTLFAAVSERRDAALRHIGAQRFRAVTTGPLTLHLARASGLENAGIHLHPVYGFACLPGSGLKGMARSHAETVWLEDQDDRVAAWNDIRAVFGWAVRSEEGKRWKPENAAELEGSSAGSVVFHDAWPVQWPRLEPDIVNNHHKGYYEGEDAPGDWDEPEMAYFLAVATGTAFDFALSPRPAGDSEPSHLALAHEWLQAALVHEGAGAKTNAGYGRFRLRDHPDPTPPRAARRIFRHALELTTPAFLAGASRQQEDCDLRPATLRGLLRWWWRTIHAAHLSRQELRRLEAAVWGDAKQGAALALSVQAETAIDRQPVLFDKDGIAQRHCVPNSQGLRYIAYGMDETKQEQRYQRWYVEPGAGWTLTLSARQGRLPEGGPSIEASDILRQGHAALWLLCRYGGVGSKARNGFGSFSDVEVDGIETVEDCREIGARSRRAAGLAEQLRLPARSSSLDDMLEVLEVATPWRDPWCALDQLGGAMQSFARKNKHGRKVALGLPRKSLTVDGRSRHASPVHYHLAPGADGALTLRMTAFPTPALPDEATSREVLKELREHLKSDLKDRTRKHGSQGTNPPRHTVDPLPKPSDRVEAVLLDEKTRKGGWKAKHEPSGLEGPIQNTAKVPADAEPGQRVSLIVASANRREIAFRWPTTPGVEARQAKSATRGRQRDGRSKRSPRRRR